jgi:hypothetical protein
MFWHNCTIAWHNITCMQTSQLHPNEPLQHVHQSQRLSEGMAILLIHKAFILLACATAHTTLSLGASLTLTRDHRMT